MMNTAFAAIPRVRPTARATAAVLAVLGCWVGGPIVAQEANRTAPAHGEKKFASDIIDSANLFSTTATAASRRELQRIEREKNVPTIIETIDSLGGLKLVDETIRRAERSGIEGIFILITKKEKKIEFLVSRKYRNVLPPAREEAIRAAFNEGFRRREFDQGLERAVAAIAKELGGSGRSDRGLPRAEAIPFLPSPGRSTAAPEGSAAPLVKRNQVRLALAGARALIAGAEAKALSMQLNVNIAVVDDGGHLIAFERMDGARPASGYTAITKATSAATIRQPTGPLPPGTANPDPLLNISLQNAAAASGGKVTTLLGGVPVVVDGQVIGAIGVGGGTGEQDAQIARAGVQVLADQLARPMPVEKETGAAGSGP